MGICGSTIYDRNGTCPKCHKDFNSDDRYGIRQNECQNPVAELEPNVNVENRLKLAFYKNLSKKIDKIINCELELQDYAEEVYLKIIGLENKLEE